MSDHKTILLAVVEREVERIKHNRAYQFLLFIGPLLGILILFFIFHKGTVRDLPVIVVDQDHSSLSVKLENAINASPDVSVIVHAHDMFQARQILDKGEAEAIVLIPSETEKSVFNNTEAPVILYINGTNVLKSSLIQRSVLTSVKTISAGIKLKKLIAEGKSEKEALARIVPISIEKHVLFNPYNNYNYFLGSALLYVTLFLFIILSSTYTLGNELKRGTGQDLLNTSNNSVRLAVMGKLLPYTIIFVGFAMLINLLLYVVEGMPIQGSYLVLFFGQLIAIITFQLMGLLFIGATSNLRLALSLVSAYSMMSITFSGLTFPLGSMPKIARLFGTLFPFTWWEKLMVSQSLRGAPLDEALPYIIYMLIFQVIALFFLKSYKKHLSDPAFWGKA